MFARLEIENFRSVRDRQSFDLILAGNAPDVPGRFAPVFSGATERVPKVVALFGPNASGKSTILRALTVLRWFIGESFQLRPTDALPAMPFLSPTGFRETTCFRVQLGGQVIEGLPPCLYTYELALRYREPNLLPFVSHEALSYAPHGRPRRLFDRQDNVVKSGDEFDLSDAKIALHSFRDNASVISTLAQFGHPISQAIYKSVSEMQTNMFLDVFPANPILATKHYSMNPDVLKRLNSTIGLLDLGIREVQIVSTPDGAQPLFIHEGLSSPLALANESHGTQNFFDLFYRLNFVLTYGGLAVIDELDSALHPQFLPEIIRWFHDPSWNPHNGQLIFSCQNASLLEHLEKEQIYFTEKSKDGRTSLYGLADIQRVRRGDNFYKKYLGGEYGAVPHLG
jgi:hypothetical protein